MAHNTIPFEGTEDEFHELVNGDVDPEVWKVVEDDDWEQSDPKHQWKCTILQRVEDGKYFSVSMSRTGSPFADWEYYVHDKALEEVVPVTNVVNTFRLLDTDHPEPEDDLDKIIQAVNLQVSEYIELDLAELRDDLMEAIS